jgi:hypothetical protein
MTAPATRITPQRIIEVDGLGTEIVACADRDAEWFAVEELCGDRWLVVTEHGTRAAAEAARITPDDVREAVELLGLADATRPEGYASWNCSGHVRVNATLRTLTGTEARAWATLLNAEADAADAAVEEKLNDDGAPDERDDETQRVVS